MDRTGMANIAIINDEGCQSGEMIVRVEGLGEWRPRLVDEPTARRELGGISHGKYWSLVESGEIETVHIGRRRLVVSESLDRYVAALRSMRDPGAVA